MGGKNYNWRFRNRIRRGGMDKISLLKCKMTSSSEHTKWHYTSHSKKLIVVKLINKFHFHLWNTNTYYRVHKNPPLDNILSHASPVHITSYLLKINFNIILPSTTKSTNLSVSYLFSEQNSARIIDSIIIRIPVKEFCIIICWVAIQWRCKIP
jgi:hypothetical protein